MEAEAVGNGSAGTSSAIAATATATEDSVMTNEPTCDMPTEITSTGTNSQPPGPRTLYSTDLRKELSLDVLASLGGASADDAKSLEESILDLAAVRADMDFISELSSLELPNDHNDSTAAEALLSSASTTPLVGSHHGSDSAAGAAPPSDISLPGEDSRLLPPLGPSLLDSLPSLPSDELAAEVSFASIMNSPLGASGALAENADPFAPLSTVVSSIDVAPPVAPSASEMSYPVSSPFTLVSSAEDNSLFAAEVQSFRAAESALAGPPASEPALVSAVPVEPVFSSATPLPARDGYSAPLEAGFDSAKSFPFSPGPSLVSDAAPVGHVISQLGLPESYPSAATQTTDSAIGAASEPLPVAFSPDPLMRGDHSGDSPNTVELGGMQFSTAAGIDLSEVSVAALHAFPSALETLSFGPAEFPPGPNSPISVENSSPLATTSSMRSAVAAAPAPAYDAVVGRSAAWTTPLTNDASGNVSVRQLSSALSSSPVQLDVSLPVNNNSAIRDPSSSPPAPLFTSAFKTALPNVTPASFTSSDFPPKVPTLSDSVASPPLTARFWDVPKPLSPGISLSVYFDGSRSSFRGRKMNRKKRSSADGSGDLKDMKGKGLGDIDKLEEVAELESMLEAQKRMVKWQIDEIQRIATLQIQLTGSNPLSEEAIWEVLGVKGGGKKSGDLISPEALKCLQEIFAIKDTLTKKEARDISFTSGASLTQVREYFAAQRSFVRKLVQQAHDEAGRLGIKNASEQSQQVANSISELEKDLGFDKLSGAESLEKIIDAMRAETGFAAQVQLLHVILRTDPAALILRRFFEKGGLTMLGEWLAEAAAEQQTSVICHLLKVLDHLPMSNAVSHQIKPLVHKVNKLRFNDASAVAGQARSLFTKWVKLFSPKTEVKSSSSPGSKLVAGSAPPSSVGPKRSRDPPPAAQAVPGSRKKKVKADEVLQQEAKPQATAVADSPTVNGVAQGASENPSSSPSVSVAPVAPVAPPAAKQRWSSTVQPSESAVAAVSVSRKRLASKSLGDPPKDRRKVLLVDDIYSGRGPVSKPAAISKTSRPLSTDDIYKAKKLERLMQEPILKSKRKPGAGPQNQSAAQDAAPLSGALKKPSFPAVQPSDTGAVKRETPSSSPGSWRGGVLTAKSSQEYQPTATRSQLPMRSPVKHDIKTAITSSLSQDIPQTISTPTSSQELSHPDDLVTGDAPEVVSFNTDLNLTDPMEIDLLPSPSLRDSDQIDLLPSPSLRDSGQERRANFLYGASSQALTATAGSSRVDAGAASTALASKDPIRPIHSSQSFVAESKGTTTAIVKPPTHFVVDNVRMPPESSELPQTRLEELSGSSALLRGLTTLVDKSAADVTGSEVQVGLEQEELGKVHKAKPSPRETSLSDFYASLRASMVRWRIPPEYQPDGQWNVAAGEDSKEREVQTGRVKREEEAYYPELSAVPNDPKDPWEEEASYDDSLTLEIFVDSGQRKVFTEANNASSISKPTGMNVVQYGPAAAPNGPDVSGPTTLNSVPLPNPTHGQEPTGGELLNKASAAVNGLNLVLQQLSGGGSGGGGGGGGGSHDPDLLALLLRNPDLVSQLTSRQAFTPSAVGNHPGVFMQSLDPLKQQQLSSGGNNGVPAGLSNPAAGDLGITSKAQGIPLQPGRSVSSVDQTQPPETMRVQDSLPMMPQPGMGQQQTMGFVPPQGGVLDNRFLGPQMPPVVPRNNNNIQDTSGWEQHLRGPPPPPPPPLPPVPPTQQQPVINHVLQQQPPPLPNQPNKQSNWPEPQGWVGMGRPPPPPPPQSRPGHEQQLHSRQTPLTHHNMRLPNYAAGMVGVPQGDGGPETSVVSKPEGHHSQRPWLLNGSHGVPPARENNVVVIHGNQDSGASRNNNNRWARPPIRPPDQHVPVRSDQHVPARPDQHGPVRPDQYTRSGNRDFTDFNNGRQQTSVVDNRAPWGGPNERARPSLPPFQGAYALPPPPPLPFPAPPLWQGQDNNMRPVQGGGPQVNPFSQGRDLRPQQQMWHNNMGPASRQIWRGQH